MVSWFGGGFGGGFDEPRATLEQRPRQGRAWTVWPRHWAQWVARSSATRHSSFNSAWSVAFSTDAPNSSDKISALFRGNVVIFFFIVHRLVPFTGVPKPWVTPPPSGVVRPIRSSRQQSSFLRLAWKNSKFPNFGSQPRFGSFDPFDQVDTIRLFFVFLLKKEEVP